MIVEIESLTNIDFGATGIEATKQNIAFTLSTFELTCPLDRQFGWLPALDAPYQIARQQNIARITEAIQTYNQNVEVIQITFEDDVNRALQGKMRPKVKVKINE